MTDEIRAGKNGREDKALGDDIRTAYGNMEPTDEAIGRMRAAVLSAAAQKQGAPASAEAAGNTAAGADGAAVETTASEAGAHPATAANAHPATAAGATALTGETGEGGAASSGRESRDGAQLPGADFRTKREARKKRSAWLWALPAAACLMLGAIVFGLANTPDRGAQPDPAMTMESPANAKSTAASNSGEREAMAPQAASGINAPDAALYAGEADGLSYAPSAPGGFNTEEYAKLEETGFVSTKANPLSTVSADVDTASYCNLRRMLNSGYTMDDIPAGSVRIEEMLNYFHYDYATPSGDDLFATTMHAGTCPWNDQTKLLVMGFATKPEDTAASKGSNLVFLIDVSGSMSAQNKLPLLQDSFATLLDGLDENDRVSIVTYSGHEEVVLEGARGNDDKEILRAIYRLDADGSTNGEAGLKMAYEIADRNRIEGGVNRIIMASDGDLNVGMTSESDLHDYVDEKRSSGIYLSVLGFGDGNYKDTKMETLADHGNGQYHYIDSIEEAERVFGQNLTANLVPLADDVKIQLEFNPAQVKGYRLIGYENRALADEDFTNDAKDAGDVGPNTQFTVAYELVLADSAYPVSEPELKYGEAAGDPANPDWLTCSMRYKPAGKSDSVAQETSVGPDVLTDNPGDDWKFAASVIEFGMALRDSEFAGTSNLQTAYQLAESSHPDKEREGLMELIKLAQKTEHE